MHLFISNTLEKEGYEVVIASNGLEAKEIFLNDAFDMILVDLRMPKMSGKELIEYIHQVDPLAVNIVITGYSDDWPPIDATDQHVFHYLKKGDFDCMDLKRVVKNGLELRKWHIEQVEKLLEIRDESIDYLLDKVNKYKKLINHAKL